MSTKRKSNDLGFLSVGFAIGWLICSILWFVTYWGSMIIAAIVMGIITGIVAFIQYKREGRVGPVAVPQRKATATPRETKRYQSRAQRARQRRSEVAQGKIRSGWTRGVSSKTHTCSIRCRDSRMPKRWCRCGCGGQRHGENRGIGTVIASISKPRTQAPRPAAVRKPAPARKAAPKANGTAKKPVSLKKTPSNSGIRKPARQAKVPTGAPETPCWVIWRDDSGQQVKANTTLATARVLQQRGRLVQCGGAK